MPTLDEIDKKIIAALQAEGRLPIVDLADRVGLSATPCQRRVKRLEEEGLIMRYAALVSPAAMAIRVRIRVLIAFMSGSPGSHSTAAVSARSANAVAEGRSSRSRASCADASWLTTSVRREHRLVQSDSPASSPRSRRS